MKYNQPKKASISKPYDGMGLQGPGVYPAQLKATTPGTNPKIGTVRGHGKGAKPGYMSKNG